MFKVQKSIEATQETSGGGSGYINNSGVYDVTINFASVEASKNGAEQMNFNVSYNGNDTVLYGPYIQNNDGKANEIGQALINKLAIIAGMEDGDDFIEEEQTHTVGKDNAEKTFLVIDNFTDMPVKMHIKFEYSKYNGNIQERKNIVAFFDEDGASAQEIVKGEDHGKQLAIVLEKYADAVTYRDGLTEEDIKEWIAAKSKGGTPAPKASSSTAPRRKFGRSA